MPTFNRFYLGTQQDDILGGNIIDSKNITGIKEGYGAKLGYKVNKAILTSTTPMRAIAGEQQSSGAVDSIIAGGDGGVIYKINGADNTPLVTMTGGYQIVQIVFMNSDYYIFYVNGNNLDVAKMSNTYVTSSGALGTFNQTFATGKMTQVSSSTKTIPFLVTGPDEILIGGTFGKFYAFNTAGTASTYNFPDETVVGITNQGSIFMIYTRTGLAYMWDGVDTIQVGSKYVGGRISRVTQKDGIDYIVTEDGRLYSGAGLQFQEITRPRTTNRLEDNSTFGDVMSFENQTTGFYEINHHLLSAFGSLFGYSSDAVSGIYEMGNLNPSITASFNKVVCSNNAGTDIDVVYDMWYYERTLQRIYFSYKAGSTYGVDYIDLKSIYTAPSGYFITNIVSSNSTYKKKLKEVRLSCGYISGSNSISLYYRGDNGAWVLISTVNEADAPINEFKFSTANGTTFAQYRDVQFKVVLTNGNGTQKTPIVHELSFTEEPILNTRT